MHRIFFLAYADELSMTYILVLGDEVFLAVGDELLLRGAVGISKRLGVSRLLAGLTIVGIGSSMPERGASIHAAL